MSLQVWLPLTKDTRNQGLSNVTVTNNGATFNSAGKLGGCYPCQFTIPNSSIINNLITYLDSGGDFSVAFWFKYTTANTGEFIQCGDSSATGSRLHFAVNNNVLRFGFRSNDYDGPTLVTNTWYHVVCSYSNSKKYIYLNGNLHGTANSGKLAIPQNNAILFTSSSVYLNDFRLYDHCLSPMEVKELSKGLVLHYPLNRQGWGQENLFNWSNNATGITLNDYQNKGSFTQFTNSLSFDPSTTVGKKYTISFWAKSPNGTTSLLLYNSNSKPKYFNFSTTLTSNLGTEWQFFKYTVTNTQYTGSDASTNTSIWKRIEIYAPNQMKVQVKQIKVEEGEIATSWCPNSSDALATTMGLNGTTEYDCSGYCNNGTRTGTFSWTSDTPKYQVSTTFDGTNYISTTTPGADILTLSCWVKTSKNKSTSQIMVADSTSQLCISFYSGTIITFYASSGYSTGSKCTLGSAYKENDWNHLVVVKTGTGTRKVYCNGVEQTATSNDYWSSSSTGFTVARRETSTPNAFYGELCDVRAYATALSADDVKSLYQNSAYIDSSGNVYGAVHSEV